MLDNNQEVIRVVETNENGQIILEKLIPGTYYIREIKAPEGYVLDMELHKIDINLNEKKTLKVYNNKIVIINTEEKDEQPKIEEVVPVVEIPKLPVTGM